MKYYVRTDLSKKEIQTYNGDENFRDMVKRKAAVELSKHIVERLSEEVEESQIFEADEADISSVKFSVNLFSDDELLKYKYSAIEEFLKGKSYRI